MNKLVLFQILLVVIFGIYLFQPYESNCYHATVIDKQINIPNSPLIYVRSAGEVEHAAVTETMYYDLQIGEVVEYCTTRGKYFRNDGTSYIKKQED